MPWTRPVFDLLALFTGSEGMLGVITEVTVKLLPKPQIAKVLLAAFDSVEKAGRAVGDIIAAGIIPGGLEMMDNLAIRAAEDFIHAGYPVDAEAILLCELDGVEADVDDDCERVRRVLEQAGATEVRQARDEAERVRFWAGRKNAFPAVGASRRIITAWMAPFRAASCPACSAGNRRVVRRIRPARRQRLPRRRRQHASADPVRCQYPWRTGSRRGPGRQDPRTVREGRWQHHRRTRCGPRENQPDVRPVQQ